MQAIKQTIVPVPADFRPMELHRYPQTNVPPFEEWLSLNLKPEEIDGDRMYLPILFTGYLKNHGYGKDEQAIQRLQNYINILDRKKKYFVVHQYDDGTLVNFKGLDVKSFSMSGKPCDYPLPLLCKPHILGTPIREKDIFCSFIGRITHPLREQMLGRLPLGVKNQYYTSTYNHNLKDYCDVLARSVFALAPRGYGVNSFRIAEALQFNAIPVYISDSFHEGHNIDFSSYGVKIEAKDVHRIDEILSAITADEIRVKQSKLKYVYDTFYSFEGTKKLILANL